MIDYLIKTLKDFGRDRIVPLKIYYQEGDVYQNFITGPILAGVGFTWITDRFGLPIWLLIPFTILMVTTKLIFGYVSIKYQLQKKEELFKLKHTSVYNKKTYNNNSYLPRIYKELVKLNERKANIYK